MPLRWTLRLYCAGNNANILKTIALGRVGSLFTIFVFALFYNLYKLKLHRIYVLTSDGILLFQITWLDANDTFKSIQTTSKSCLCIPTFPIMAFIHLKVLKWSFARLRNLTSTRFMTTTDLFNCSSTSVSWYTTPWLVTMVQFPEIDFLRDVLN